MAVVALASSAGTAVYLGASGSAVLALAAPPAKLVAAKTTQPVPYGSPLAVAVATAEPCPSMPLAIAFTSNVRDTLALHLHLPWGKPGDPEGLMVEDYGAYDGTAIREQLPVYDITSGALHVLAGHNAIDIALDSGTPLYAVTSGTVFTMDNWTIPGYPQGYAAVVISDVLRDDAGEPIAFLYGHVRQFDTPNWQHVNAGALIARSGGGETDPGRGFSDMPNVHFEVIESAQPLRARAGTVNPHQFLENLYAYAAHAPAGC
jgi:murein DD-endopeptidase MepM/ murein hydrolase activator NlpD